MRLGIFARADHTGLSVETQEYVRHLKPDKVLCIDIDELNASYGKITVTDRHMYDDYNVRYTNGVPTEEDYAWLTDDIDIIFVKETPINHDIYPIAKSKGVYTVLACNAEFLDKISPKFSHFPMADEIWVPSTWHSLLIMEKAEEWGCAYRYVPVPINRELFPFRPRNRATQFLHIAGHPAHEDRNGTKLVFEAIPLVKSDVQFVIRSQEPIDPGYKDPRLKLAVVDIEDNRNLYHDESVLLLPRRYGGLSLQLHEALSLGMIPVMLDIPPQKSFLNENWLVEARFQKKITTRFEFDIYDCSPQDLADKIDEIATATPELMSIWSHDADRIAEELNWEKLAPLYIEALSQCLEK